MSKQSPSAYVIIPTYEGLTLPLQFLFGLPYMPMRTHTPEEWKILSHVFLTPNMDWDTSVFNFTDAEYDEWLEQFGLWDCN